MTQFNTKTPLKIFLSFSSHSLLIATDKKLSFGSDKQEIIRNIDQKNLSHDAESVNKTCGSKGSAKQNLSKKCAFFVVKIFNQKKNINKNQERTFVPFLKL